MGARGHHYIAGPNAPPATSSGERLLDLVEHSSAGMQPVSCRVGWAAAHDGCMGCRQSSRFNSNNTICSIKSTAPDRLRFARARIIAKVLPLPAINHLSALCVCSESKGTLDRCTRDLEPQKCIREGINLAARCCISDTATQESPRLTKPSETVTQSPRRGTSMIIAKPQKIAQIDRQSLRLKIAEMPKSPSGYYRVSEQTAPRPPAQKPQSQTARPHYRCTGPSMRSLASNCYVAKRTTGGYLLALA